METFPIRVGANAIIVEDGRLLLVKFDDDTGIHFNLPGGGVKHGESVSEALVREVHEETTASVDVEQLIVVHEHLPRDHDETGDTTHKVTFFFECEIVDATAPTLPADPDPNQVDVEWIPLATVDEHRIIPQLDHQWSHVVANGPRSRFVVSE